MGFPAGTIKDSWQPEMSGETTTPSYWLNWKVLVCGIWLLMSMVFASLLISKYEGNRMSSRDGGQGQETGGEKGPGILYEDEVWRPCLKGMHPFWLLGFRAVSFFVMLILLVVNAIFDGGSIFYYYTQWTFTLVTMYFGLGSVLSVYGCYAHRNKVDSDRADIELVEAGQGNSANVRGPDAADKDDLNLREHHRQDRQIARLWGYAFQIMFQINSGAVLLTDCVFWFIIVPFRATTTRNYDLNFFMVNMHSVNIIFLLGDTALNSLRFPWFRIAYFFLWTALYAIFQWMLHACISIWWPYPFLDLSASLAPLWYAVVGLMHFLCYGAFVLVTKLKHYLLSRYFPGSYQHMMR